MEFREQFIKSLQNTLNHLADPKKLLASPMVDFFQLSSRPYKILALQNILIDAIKNLQPPPDSPPTSKAWRQYESLYYRYIAGFSQREVAEQLNIGVRHLQREQNGGLELLADSLIRQFNIKESPLDYQSFNSNSSIVIEEDTEFSWLKDYSNNNPTVIQQELTNIFETVSIIANDHNVQINMNNYENLPDIAIHPVVFNQIMLNLLTAGIIIAKNGWISMAVFPAEDGICFEFQTGNFTNNPIDSLNKQTVKITMAQRLLSIYGGKLEVTETFSLLTCTVTIPIFDRQIILVIDDNPDTLQLFERYCSNTRYQFISCPDPSDVINLAIEQSPDIIIIDVMMPRIDGWQIMSRLRMHPMIGSTPIIICTILPLQELALSLGATAYIQKPVNRQEFLKMLEKISLEARKFR